MISKVSWGELSNSLALKLKASTINIHHKRDVKWASICLNRISLNLSEQKKGNYFVANRDIWILATN